MSEELWTCKKHCEGEWYVYKGEEIISSTDNEIDANSFCEEHNASIQRVLEKKEAVTRNTAVLQNLRKWSQARHSISCPFPEGCSCGAAAWNILLHERDCLRKLLSEHDGQPESARGASSKNDDTARLDWLMTKSGTWDRQAIDAHMKPPSLEAHG